jgi:predicted Fe-S protein YdhL (DUF1289 family)
LQFLAAPGSPGAAFSYLAAMNSQATPILSPCIGVCSLDDAGLCEGCHRSSAEIAGWIHFSDQQRQHLMDVVLPVREAQRA